MASKPSGGEEFADLLHAHFRAAPWWVGPIAAALTYAVCRWAILWLMLLIDNDPDASVRIGALVGTMSKTVAPILAGLVVVVWLAALVAKFVDGQRLDQQRGIDTIRELSWREFEQLLAEAYRRQGYRVTDTGQTHGRAQPDGGIDLILERDGQRTLVQCKQWKTQKVGVKTARELYGVVASQHADCGVLVTSGQFTKQAHDFAQDLPLNLIDGPKLQTLVQSIQRHPSTALGTPLSQHSKIRDQKSAIPSVPTCPRCQSPMTQRTAKRGPNVSQQFWGCTMFPKCMGTRTI